MAGTWRAIPHDSQQALMPAIVGQILRFGAVGLANTAIGLLAIYALMYFWGIDPAVANAVGYAIGLTVSFALNRIWTFNDTRSIKMVLPSYLTVAVLCYLSNLTVVLIGVKYFTMDPYLVQFFGISVYTTMMFLGCKWLVFRPARGSRSQ